MAPLVSILIPAYNAEKWIRETIKSAVGQTWPEKEVIIVDDGSTDNTLGISKEFESKFVKVITQENRGATSARNKALSLSQGQYIQWLDHDDLLSPNKISEQLKNGDAGGDSRVLFSSACGMFYYRYNKAKFIQNSLCRDLTPMEFFLLKFTGNIWLQSSVWLVSRRLTEMAGPWLEIKTPDDDGEYFSRVVMASEKIKFVPEAKCYWRIGNYSSLSERRSDEALEGLFISTARCIHLLMSLEDSEKTRAASLKFLQDRFMLIYPEQHKLVEKAYDLARKLGGTLLPPKLKWKYVPFKKIFGYQVAKDLSIMAPRIKVCVFKNWDRLMYKCFL